MRPPLPHPAPDERGFILVGVVTFMLALTILGLSLFALSSYEAQFFVASAAREQSLQNSESGMELVKTLLASTDPRLERAHRAEGQLGVTHALAYQRRNGDTTSTGPVDWADTVTIVVAATSGGVERTLQASFIPTVLENPYQRLLAAGQGVSVNTKNSTNPSVLELTGRVWHPVASDADTTWTKFVDWKSGNPINRGAPPAPFADAFVDDHMPGQEAGSDLENRDDYELTFKGTSTRATYFHSPPSPTDAGEDKDEDKVVFENYSFYAGADLTLKVQGVAVWVLPQCACFKKQVTVKRKDGDVPSTLVIVAKANGGQPGLENRALWFRGGLDIDRDYPVQVYLVSQGDISIVHDWEDEHDWKARRISIVAGGRIEIGGPESGHTFSLRYDADSMDALAEQLLALDALPQVVGGTGTNYALARQTWVETTPR
jgi:hypothetical protein